MFDRLMKKLTDIRRTVYKRIVNSMQKNEEYMIDLPHIPVHDGYVDEVAYINNMIRVEIDGDYIPFFSLDTADMLSIASALEEEIDVEVTDLWKQYNDLKRALINTINKRIDTDTIFLKNPVTIPNPMDADSVIDVYCVQKDGDNVYVGIYDLTSTFINLEEFSIEDIIEIYYAMIDLAIEIFDNFNKVKKEGYDE